MAKAYILLGGNLGDVKKTMEEALLFLSAAGDVKRYSSLYRTSAWGMEDQPDFLNQVAELETSLHPEDLLGALKRIEERAGRIRLEKYGPRILDLDILFYDDLVCSGNPEIPHPRLHLRRFTLVPLVELAPELVHPVLGKSLSELLAKCPDKGVVSPLGDEPAD